MGHYYYDDEGAEYWSDSDEINVERLDGDAYLDLPCTGALPISTPPNYFEEPMHTLFTCPDGTTFLVRGPQGKKADPQAAQFVHEASEKWEEYHDDQQKFTAWTEKGELSTVDSPTPVITVGDLENAVNEEFGPEDNGPNRMQMCLTPHSALDALLRIFHRRKVLRKK